MVFQVLDLESHVYRHEKLTEALVDIIQSHDPDFELEEEGILQSYVDQKKGVLIIVLSLCIHFFLCCSSRSSKMYFQSVKWF